MIEAGEAAAQKKEAGEGAPAGAFDIEPDPTADDNLRDPAHLELFVTWHALGGPRNPPTPLELLQWPPDLTHDFEYLSRRFEHIKHRRDRRTARRAAQKSKKKAPR